jgi:hypothetical protein
MPTPERRLLQRNHLPRLACIQIEPENGGIVLNASSSGLCFHAMSQVERNGTFRFALVQQNRRIDICGELIWTDETSKIGGVKFAALSPQAREQIESWMAPDAVAGGSPSTVPSPFARLFSSLDTLKFHRKPAIGQIASTRSGIVRLKVSGFVRGVATGLLAALIVVFAITFVRGHLQQFGESLIHVGQRLAGREHPPGEGGGPASVKATIADGTQVNQSGNLGVPIPSRAAHAAPQTMPPQPGSSIHVPATTPATQRVANRPVQPGRSQPGFINAARLPATPAAAVSNTLGKTTSNNSVRGPGARSAPVLPPDPPLIAAAAPGRAPSLNSAPVIPELLMSPIRLPAPVQTSLNELPFRPSMYFDLGRFKEESRARDLSNRMAQLGFRSNVFQKGLWRNSYQVLVGPYNDEQQASKIGEDLVAEGYRPRPFERGSRTFAFGSGVVLNGAMLPVGDFTISWESYVDSAKVKFAQREEVLTRASGRWVKQPQRFRCNEYVYVRIGSGSRRLVEVHFAGMDRALVFRD